MNPFKMIWEAIKNAFLDMLDMDPYVQRQKARDQGEKMSQILDHKFYDIDIDEDSK